MSKNNKDISEKLDDLIELVADQSMVGSSQGHNLSDLKNDVSDLKEAVGRLDERIKSIDKRSIKTEKRFTLTKISTFIFTIFSTSIATITACVLLLKQLGVFDLIREAIRAAGMINGSQ